MPKSSVELGSAAMARNARATKNALPSLTSELAYLAGAFDAGRVAGIVDMMQVISDASDIVAPPSA